jgi:iron complex outermembrane receptor protein
VDKKNLKTFCRACVLLTRPRGALIMIGFLLHPPGAWAASIDETPQAEAGQLQEITVTARKREENVRDVPAAITVLTSQTLERYDMSDLEKIAASTPEFTVARASNGSGASLSIRGIGSSFTSIGIEQSVAVNVDGVYYGEGRIINEAFFDLKQVELIKGPDALFFGKNGDAGVISAASADPSQKFEAYTRVGYEFEAEQPYFEAMVSGPLNDVFSVRLAVHGSAMGGGYVDNVAPAQTYTYTDVATGKTTTVPESPAQKYGPDEDQIAERLTLLYTPTANITNTTKISADNDHIGNASWNYIIYECPNNAHTPCGRNFVNAMNDYPAAIGATLPLSKPGGQLYNTYDSFQFTNTTQVDFGLWNLTSILNYQRFENTFSIDADYFSSSANQTFANEQDKYDALSAELRGRTSFDGPVNILIGGLFQKTKLDLFGNALIAGLANSDATPAENFESFEKVSGTDGKTYSPFAQLTWKFLDDFEFAGGARYTSESKDSTFIQPYVNPALTGVFIANKLIALDQQWSNVSPEATLRWKPTADLTVYGAYKTGYKSGGFSNTAILGAHTLPSDFAFGPETSKGFELGLKSELLDRTLNISVTAYDYKFDNLQVEVFNSTLISFHAENAGSASTRGVETEVQWIPPVSGLTLNASLNYNKAKYDSFTGPCYAGQTIAEGCSIVSSSGGLFQKLDGAPTAVSPLWTGALGADYEVGLGPVDMTLSANARYSDGYSISQYNNPNTIQSAYTMLDAALKFDLPDRFEVAVIGRNLTDKFVLTGTLDVVGTGSGTGTTHGVLADQVGLVNLPRTVQLQLTKRF